MEKISQPSVSIISINYNQAEVTLEMIKSLRSISYKNFKIIIVDNHSQRQNPDEIKEKYPEIELIKSEKNLGFAGGNNLGIKHAKSDYYLLLNNDTEVTPGFLEPMVDLMEKNQSIGIVSPKIYYFYEDNTLQYAGTSPINTYTSRSRHYGNKQKDIGQYDTITETHYSHGACMLISNKVIEKIGLMYEDYFLYYEEMDYCESVKKAGFKIFFQPKSKILHKESSTTGKDSPLKTFYLNRNRLLYLRRNTRGFKLALAYIYYISISLPKNSAKLLIDRKFKNIGALYRALLWNIKNLQEK